MQGEIEVIEAVALPRVECPEGGGERCPRCVSMCAERPGWPTVREAEALLDAGYGGRLMLDWWVMLSTPDDVYVLSPAFIGREGRYATERPEGRCTFLTREGLCELHEVGKPLECAVADCRWEERTEERKVAVARMKAGIVGDWSGEAGRALVARWKREVGLEEEGSDDEG